MKKTKTLKLLSATFINHITLKGYLLNRVNSTEHSLMLVDNWLIIDDLTWVPTSNLVCLRFQDE